MTQTFHDKSFITNNVILSCSNFQDFVLMFWNIKWAAGYFCPGTGKHFHSSVTKSIKSRRNQFTKSTFVWGHAQKFWNISQKRAINRHPFILQSSGWLYKDVPLVSWELITFHSCSDLIKSCHHPSEVAIREQFVDDWDRGWGMPGPSRRVQMLQPANFLYRVTNHKVHPAYKWGRWLKFYRLYLNMHSNFKKESKYDK